MQFRNLTLGCLFILVFVIAGCHSKVESVSSMVQLQATTEVDDTTTPVPTVAATETPTRTATATHTATATLTATATPTETITPSPTPFLGFEESTLNSSFQQNGQTVMIFSVPGVSRTYFALVNNYFGMTCTPSGSYTDVLVCSAPVFRISTTTPKIIFYEDETYSTAIHSAYFFVPVSSGLVIPTPIPWIISWAPDDGTCERGINVFCETEYRTYNGVPCMDATCSDTCGYYYSVDNCPPSGDWVAIARPPGPGWEPLDVIKK